MNIPKVGSASKVDQTLDRMDIQQTKRSPSHILLDQSLYPLVSKFYIIELLLTQYPYFYVKRSSLCFLGFLVLVVSY